MLTTPTHSLRAGDHVLTFGRVPLVMGVLNVTPDSFCDGGQFRSVDDAERHAHAMANAGAAIVDVGGESTRPGSRGISEQEEVDRVAPIVDALVRGSERSAPLTIPVSIDTRKAGVARAALASGAQIVNDVTAAPDEEMASVLRDAGDSVPVVLMHMRGDPATMQNEPHYGNVVTEVREYLRERAEALAASGIQRSRIVVDPGIGFGKRLEDNLDLLKNIDVLKGLGYPVLIGASRKTFIGRLLDAPVEQRLAGSLAVAAQCYDAGTEILRVHDVRETVEMLRVLDSIRYPDPWREKGW